MANAKQTPVTKERLKQYRLMMIEFQNQVERARQKRESLVSPFQDYINTSNAKHSADRMAETLVQVIDFESMMDKNITGLLEEIAAIEEAIDRLNDSCEREVLRLRYFECKSWDEIREIMHFELSKIHYVHGNALRNIYDATNPW